MRFEELSKKHQDFLMYCLSDYIKAQSQAPLLGYQVPSQTKVVK